jgi:hypothetical protein
MKLDNIRELLKNKKREELIPTILLGVSVLFGILILLKITGFFMASAKAKSIVEQAVEQNTPDPNNIEKQLASSAAITEELKKNNLFAPPPARKNPVQEVSGIFGDQVLIRNKWYNVGDTIKDAKIVAIGATSVTVAWDGKEKIFLPIEAKLAEGKGGSKGRPAAAQNREGGSDNQKGNGKGAQEVTVRAEGGSPPQMLGARGRSGGGFMAMRQRFENMSDEERQAFRERMRQRFSRNRGGGRNFGGRGGRGPGGR